MIQITVERLQNTFKKKGCLHILFKSQGGSLCVWFLDLDHCVVINMHWKVLCFCWSHGSLICYVFMYSIYSGLFSRANLAMCQTCICASRLRKMACLIYCKGKQSTMVPCKKLLEWGSQAALITICVSVAFPKSGTCILWKPSVSWIL